jgi:nitrogenase-associated protein
MTSGEARMSIIFFEKHGCQNNRKQRQMLQAQGLTLEVRNLFEQDWTAETLRPFFIGKPVHWWFNPAAPSIKNGQLNPHHFDETAALQAMVDDPILIRRPLIQYQQFFTAGFDWQLLQQALGIHPSSTLDQDITSCTHSTVDADVAHACACQKSP